MSNNSDFPLAFPRSQCYSISAIAEYDNDITIHKTKQCSSRASYPAIPALLF